MRSADEVMTELQGLLAPLAYRAFDAESVYREVERRVEELRGFGVDELLLGSIDLQARIIVGMAEGNANDAVGCLLNEIADWKQANGGQ